MHSFMLAVGGAIALCSSSFAADGLAPTARSVVIPPANRAALARADRVVDVRIPIDGRDATLRLVPHSLRSADFRLRVQRADGSMVDVAPPAPRTFVGSVIGEPLSTVRASAVDGGVNAIISIGGREWYVQPSDGNGTHAVYTPDDVPATDGACGLIADDHGHGLPPAQGGIAGLNCSWLTEIGIDADFEFYQQNSSSVPATVADIENVINGVSAIYNTECNLDFAITEIVVRTSSVDPYTTSVPGDLLGELATEWTTNQNSITHDIAHLFTGKNLSGGIIGIAVLGGLCDNGAKYGLSQSKWIGIFSLRVSLTAHEIGHNFGAPHCNGQTDCGVMCASINQCAGPADVFGATSAGIIMNGASLSGCLGPPGPSFVNASDGLTCGVITVNFTPAPAATTHTLWRATASNDPNDAVLLQAGVISPYIDAAVVPGTIYSYWITATDPGGCDSNFGPEETGFAPVLPPTPGTVTASDGIICSSVSVSWSNVASASSFAVWRGVTSDSAQATQIGTDNASPFTDSSAVPGQIYTYWVRSVNGCGQQSAFGANDLGSRKAPPAAGVPSATETTCASVTVTWPAVSGATSYTLWRGTSSDSAQAAVLTPGAVSPAVDATGTPGVAYWYFVQSHNSCGAGALGAGDKGRRASGLGDANGDCAVDGADITTVLGNWGGSGLGDLNGDGTVDGADITVILGDWD